LVCSDHGWMETWIERSACERDPDRRRGPRCMPSVSGPRQTHPRSSCRAAVRIIRMHMHRCRDALRCTVVETKIQQLLFHLLLVHCCPYNSDMRTAPHHKSDPEKRASGRCQVTDDGSTGNNIVCCLAISTSQCNSVWLSINY